jgi:predicted alpha/beta superfamily hydrolase
MTTTATPAVLPDSRTHVVYSSIVGENYQLSVWMPPSYTASVARFPVLYVLDAAMTFAFAAQATMINVFGGVVPEVLVVGIGRPVISAMRRDRAAPATTHRSPSTATRNPAMPTPSSKL